MIPSFYLGAIHKQSTLSEHCFIQQTKNWFRLAKTRLVSEQAKEVHEMEEFDEFADLAKEID